SLGGGQVLLVFGAHAAGPLFFAGPVKFGRLRSSELLHVVSTGRGNVNTREECFGAIEVPRRDHIVFVVVTLCAAYREPEKEGSRRGNHLTEQDVAAFLAAWFGERGQPKKRQRYYFLRFRQRQRTGRIHFGEFISCDLLLNELVIRLVVIKGIDYIIAIPP